MIVSTKMKHLPHSPSFFSALRRASYEARSGVASALNGQVRPEEVGHSTGPG